MGLTGSSKVVAEGFYGVDSFEYFNWVFNNVIGMDRGARSSLRVPLLHVKAW